MYKPGENAGPESQSALGTSPRPQAVPARAQEHEAGAGREEAQRRGELAVQEADVAYSDRRISDSVKARCSQSTLVDARHVEVSTLGGIVTLRGWVRCAAEHAMVVGLARRVHGVLHVVAVALRQYRRLRGKPRA
ncbi:BON domain-containing protein [Paludibacterium yongneupense]|uniref:BON domain-containing protein n=1 Tax=Paludibacterium yongneupense TaxID=400061 RepID=UPI00041E9AB3|nr:BON domain-containing protein [Paludibacterium yongneupense]